MRAFVVMLIVLGIWLAYKHHNPIGSLARPIKLRNPAPASGSVSTLSKGFGATGNYPTSGNNSPGSGVRSAQPNLVSSWALGRNFGSYGSTGPTWSAQ